MSTIFSIAMFILGACLGSFLCCQARRLRLKEQGKPQLGSRSVCMKCHRQLKWYDNIPIISWLLLRGRCRYCHSKIGIAELISEVCTAVAFVLFSLTINMETASFFDYVIFVSATILTLLLIFLAIYDGLYGELPSLCLTLAIICAIITATLKIWASISISEFSPNLILKPLLAMLILSGLYLLLYLISKGRWVGDGDWILCISISLAIGTPWLALVILFLANLSACIIMAPSALSRKSNKKTIRKIHFGPFLVTAFVIVYAFAEWFNSFVV